MAKPIEETPVLYDNDAYRFEMAMRNVKPLSVKKQKRMKEAYEIMSKIATFSL